MKYILALCCSLFLYTAQAQTPPLKDGTRTQLLLNMTVPCREDGVNYITDTVDEYNEQEFASGVISINPMGATTPITVDLLMYVNPKTRTFTLFTLQPVGEYEVACVVAGGIKFTPFSGEYRAETND